MENDNKKIEVLLSTMYKESLDFLSDLNIQTDVVIVNQTDKQNYIVDRYKDNNVIFISTFDRGLSRSRNKALENASADICLICDDDVQYLDGYGEIVIKAFNDIKDADIIIFDSIMTYRDGKTCTKGFKKIEKVHKFKTFSSVLIAFKRKSIIENNIRFNEDFGTGSGKYEMCEDSIFLRDCYKKGLKAYIYPRVIHKCIYGESTWFKGYNEKYFFDIGAYLAQSFKKTKFLVKWYYPIRMYKLSNLKWYEIIKFINAGITGFNKNMKYSDYFNYKK